ncbi:hypothetical protein EAF04_010933 [Stromatinia cepivora]|nr:hypothetical protein EAF04_010933 [Stromatinia cepivora]
MGHSCCRYRRPNRHEGINVLFDGRPQVNQYQQSNAYVHNGSFFLTAQYIVPNILHVCQDAREVVLKYYRPVFARELGGAPVYMAIDYRRTPDTFLFSHLTALQMLRSRTQNFRITRNDLNFIKSAIVCTNIHEDLCAIQISARRHSHFGNSTRYAIDCR